MVHIRLGPEGAQLYLESYQRDPNFALSSYPPSELGWVPSEGWELYAVFGHEPERGKGVRFYCVVEKRIQ